MKVLSFDTETTGRPDSFTDPLESWPRLVSFGYWLQDFDDLKFSKGEELIIPEGFEIPEEATRIHGITTEQAIEKGIPLEEGLKKIEALFKKADLVIIHNSNFDLSIVTGEQIRKGRHEVEYLKKQKEKVFCMMQNTVKILQLPKSKGGGYKWPSLSELCTFCGVVNDNEHNAKSDVEALMKCFFFLNKHKYLSLVSV